MNIPTRKRWIAKRVITDESRARHQVLREVAALDRMAQRAATREPWQEAQAPRRNMFAIMHVAAVADLIPQMARVVLWSAQHVEVIAALGFGTLDDGDAGDESIMSNELDAILSPHPCAEHTTIWWEIRWTARLALLAPGTRAVLEGHERADARPNNPRHPRYWDLPTWSARWSELRAEAERRGLLILPPAPEPSPQLELLP